MALHKHGSSHKSKRSSGHKSKGGSTKSKRQVRFLLSKVSPLSAKEKAKLKRELHSGAVKVK